MPKLINLAGRAFGRLTVLSLGQGIETSGGNKKVTWSCKCKCGSRIEVPSGRLLSGHTNSCGCWRREQAAKSVRAINTTHGMRNTRLYKIWLGMIARCTNPKHKSAKTYFGLPVAKAWMRFEGFAKWALASGYRDDLTLDRKDNAKGYSSGNCRWATTAQQANNKTTSVRLVFNGQEKTIAQWSAETGIPAFTIRERLERGWTIEKILTTKPRRKEKAA